MRDVDGLGPKDLVALLGLLRGLYGDGPFTMSLGADKELQQEAQAFAESKGWCAEVEAWGNIELLW